MKNNTSTHIEIVAHTERDTFQVVMLPCRRGFPSPAEMCPFLCV